ncbi:MAG: tripartite tricarboxylate transporter substrate binding protein, partial [Betaproteobacteria bacterium]|nr:tripartite tricarboxylate transporter substrate binding protein [Betaproteobacteria bacterium]
GYTLLLGEESSLENNPQIEKVPYDPMREFAAVSPLAAGYHVLVVHPALPARSVKELIALAKTRPGESNYASGGAGSNLFLIAEIFKTTAGINMTHVPYKGAGPAGLSVLSGETQTMFASITALIQFVRSGRLVALAVTSPRRLSLLPEVPTLVESGLRGVEVAAWFALMAPAATPREIIARLNAEVVKLAATPDYRQQLGKQGYEPLTSSPEQFSAYLKAEVEKWGKVIKALGMKRD